MEINEFIDALEGTKCCLSWKTDKAGAIRATYPDGTGAFCPITAVAGQRSDARYRVDQAWDAAKELGLDHAYTMLIVSAADLRKDTDAPTKLMRELMEQVLFNESE